MRIGAAVVAVLSIMTVAASAHAQARPTLQSLEDTAATVRALLEAQDRAAAEKGGSAAADRTHGEVAALLDKARGQMKAGALTDADRTLQQAYAAVTQQVAALRGGQTLETRKPNQYQTGGRGPGREAELVRTRIDNVGALLAAYRRIAPEKGGADGKALSRADGLLSTANERLRSGKVAEARSSVDQAYDLASKLVVGVRQGDKLVKTLKFDTPADEYRYEIDRNDSYRMLVKLALANAGAEGGTAVRPSDAAQTAADRLRADAEETAKAGRYADAIRLLEQATDRLKQVIRATGLMIPG